jgi:hypothetical protein
MHDLEKRLNDLDLEAFDYCPTAVAAYGSGVEKSLKRHMNRDETYAGLRLSQIGKPAVLQALWGLGFPYDGGIALKQRILFHMGDVWEDLLIFLLKAAGYEILDHNNNTLYQGQDPNTGDKYLEYMGVRGHSDIVAMDPKTQEQFIVEAKTSNDRYFNSFIKTPDDSRGYISQLALYEACLGLPGVWVFYNKNTSEIKTQVLTPEVREYAINRANHLIPLLQKIKDWETLSEFVEQGHLQAPPPQPEVYRRAQTGAYLVPASMKFTKYRHCFYDVVTQKNGYGKDTEYVIGLKPTPVHPNDILDEFLLDEEAS